MTYALQSDLVTRFGERELIQLTDRATPAAGTIDATVVSAALSDADDEINSYIGAVATLPLSNVPLVLKRRAADIARYYLYKDRPLDGVRQAYEDAIAWLKDVVAGRATLGLDAEGDAPAETSEGAEVDAADRVFTRDTLCDF